MIRIIEMPKLSDTMEDGGISEWFKKEGDFVEEGDPLLAIETDKATMEYDSPEEGFLLKILAEGKTQIALGVPIAVLGEKGESFDLEKILGTKEKGKKELKSEKKVEGLQKEKAVSQKSEASFSKRIKASPLAKKIAEEKNIDLASIVGSGPYGRVIAFDVKSSGKNQKQEDFFAAYPDLVEKIIPMTPMRRTIARRLSASKREAPHFYLNVSCRTGELTKWRSFLNESSGVKISLNDLLIFVCSRALAKHPEINSLLKEDAVVHCASVDISIAVALPEGLITPVLKNCEKKNIWQISEESKELIKKAKSKKLSPEEYTGGSFTISNLGMTRVDSFTAVINSPQTCILAVGRSQMRAVVKDDGSLASEETMTMTMSCDHRAVDGYMGALFLETLLKFLENPILLFSGKK